MRWNKHELTTHGMVSNGTTWRSHTIPRNKPEAFFVFLTRYIQFVHFHAFLNLALRISIACGYNKEGKMHTNRCYTSSNNHHDNSNPGDSELELQILENCFVHVSSPLNSFNNTGKIIILKYNICWFLCYICAWHTLRYRNRQTENHDKQWTEQPVTGAGFNYH